jgi:putative membrane-bound dehydrogenase-like protein
MRSLPLVTLLVLTAAASAADGNRLTYLDESDPYYVHRRFPKLVTPQWVGEDGVEAVVILAIDDMRGHEKWETYLRPILNRLKRIDGRAPVSIMTCQIDPNEKHLQTWLKEGVSLETHTYDHPCPLLRDGDFKKAKGTYDRCVDLLASVLNSKPVAFRTPCCDSLNTVSPRFFAEIFNRTTEKGNFLSIDSSVFHLFTSNDPALPRELVQDADGTERFRKYLPADRTFVNYIEDYPYPYVIGRTCWEFPCMVPSDWAAQHLHKPNNPITVRDWKAALDCTVIKQGVFCLVFHPHGWIKSEQVIDLIDHAVAKHGKKVKFLTFKEAQERLDKNLLGGQPLRVSTIGLDNGVRLLDVNNDGYLDVVVGNEKMRQTRLWLPRSKVWGNTEFPVQLVLEGLSNGTPKRFDGGVFFGILRPDGYASILPQQMIHLGGWHFDGSRWVDVVEWTSGLKLIRRASPVTPEGTNRATYLRDLDRDGICEVIVCDDHQRDVFVWSVKDKEWRQLPFTVPGSFILRPMREAGVRFIDINEDGRDDLIWSSEKEYGIYLFTDMEKGWSRKIVESKAGDKGTLPMIARGNTNNGSFVHSRSLWWQNENTNLLKDLVDRRSFNDLLKDVEPGPKTPEASLCSIQTRPGFTVELMAAEPLVQDPIAFAFGPDGKLWVVEMGDYPLGLDGMGKPGGKIKILESIKGDGKYDKATVFLDNIPYPTGVLPWRKGVLVTCAPEIFYAEDTDGDGKADKREPLYTGFVEGNQQHRVNSLVWGLDNWIYCANGDSGGKVKSVKTGAVVDIRGRDFRIRPDTGEIELQTGQTQFGRSRDDWGNWFGNNNANPMWHFVLDDRYQRRNPHLPAPDPRVTVPVRPGAAPVFPVSRTLPRFNDLHTANHFTSACSTIVYRDDLFGPPVADAPGSPVFVFVSEPVHNLVHREVMTAKGVTFSSQRAADEQKSEFLASSDNWFRPTTIATGPDSALWIADMYRHVIEHPQWIPREWQKKLDLRAGHDKGRIYRVYPVDKPPRPIPRLDKLDTAGLVAALDSPSGWQRDMAQMLLVWKQDKAAVPPLEKLAAEGKRPLARLHALCTLDGLGALEPTPLLRALADVHPGVRRHAVRLCEPQSLRVKPGGSLPPELGTALVKLVDDADPQVRMQLAYTLGEWDDPQAGRALGQLAVKDAGDRYLSAAVMSSVNAKNLDAVLLSVMANSRKAAPPSALVENLLRLANALGNRKALTTLLTEVAKPDGGKYASWQFTALAGLLDALDQRSMPLAKVRDEGDDETKAAVKRLAGLFEAARVIVADAKVTEERLLAVRLLGRGLDRHAQDLKILAGLLVPQVSEDLQSAAVTGLGRLREPQVPDVLLRGWKGYSPALRSQAVEVLLRRDEWLQAVLDAVEAKQVLPFEIDAARRQRLLEHKTAAVRDRAGKLFADAVSADRQKVLDEFRSVLSLKGDAARGAPLFVKHCAACHKLGSSGNDVGPDLAALGDKSPESLLVAVLDPNRAVEARYVNYLAVTKNGLTYSGVLAGETGTSITVVGADGKPQVILRTDLAELTSTGKSAMPEGLEKDLKPQDLADVIVHVRAAGPQPQRRVFEGNQPELVKPDKDGSLLLRASNCEIYGSNVLLEKQYGNLGFWRSENDHAVWTAEVPRTGKYAVWLDYACDDGSAGNSYVLQAGLERLTGKVAGTGNWDTYKQVKVGEIQLQAGQQRLVFRSVGRIRTALIDLRSIRLAPLGPE